MSDDDIVQRAERRIAAMTDDERHELLHRNDGYYAFDRYRHLPRGERRFYKLLGGDQFRLIDGAWEPLGLKGTYKNEPRWWLSTGDEDFHRVAPTELPEGTPL